MTDGHNTSSNPPSEAEWVGLARHLTGETSPEEAARIQSLLAGRPEDLELLEALDRAMSRLTVAAPSDLDVEGALQQVKARMKSVDSRPLKLDSERRHAPIGTRMRWRVPAPAIAAAAILAIGLGTWLGLKSRSAPDADTPIPRMLATGVGVRDSMALPDGSHVVLGPLSSIILARGYGEVTRDVEIRGEAWFDVKHDDRRPFTVRAGEATIVDLGTKFAVRSDSPDGVAVTVTEGSVSLRPVNTSVQQGVVLKAGDNGLLKPEGQVIARRGTASEDDIAWLKGRLVFREAPISEVVAAMRRWYGIQLRVTDQSLLDKHITATFSGEPAERVLEVLRLTLGAEIERKGDTAIVRPAAGRMRSR